MSIASAITAAQEKVENAYTAVSNKGGTLPATQDLSNLPTAITSIPTGGSAPVINELNVVPSTSSQTITAPTGVDGYSPINVSAVTSSIDANITAGNIKKDVSILGVTGTYEGTAPTGTMYIISNGTYNVADKAIANVQVPTTAPARYVEKAVNVNKKLINTATIINLNGVEDVGDYVLYGQYCGAQFPVGTTVDLSSLTTLSGSYACNRMFYGCSNLTSVDLSGLTTISGSYACNRMFNGCPQLTSVDLSALTTISGDYANQLMFQTCLALTSVDLSALTTISGNTACANMFNGCTGLTSVDLSALTTISGNTACSSMFNGCTGLTSVDLSALTTISGNSACSSMFNGCTGLTSVNLSTLTTINGVSACSSMFDGCTGLTSANLNGLNAMTGQISSSTLRVFPGCTHLESVTLGGLTASTFVSSVNQIQYLFNNATGSNAPNGCTIHFPSNFDPSDPNHTFDASTLTGYPTFGGDANYIHVAFDLPATE